MTHQEAERLRDIARAQLGRMKCCGSDCAEAEAWERFNYHVGHCKGCKDFGETGVLCAEGMELNDEWTKVRHD